MPAFYIINNFTLVLLKEIFMKYCLLFLLFNLFSAGAFCQKSNSKDLYIVPDSIKATGFYAEVKMNTDALKKRTYAGISVNGGISLLPRQKKEQKIFSFNYFAKPGYYIVYGKDTDTSGHDVTWKYDWKANETYPLLIATASDSAAHKTLFSGYVYLPVEKKWKLIATRSYNDTVALKYFRTESRKTPEAIFSNRWLQRINGSWKALDSQTTKAPSLRHMSNIDSLDQQKMEEDLLRSKLPKDSVVYEDGVFYQSLKEGAGRLVNVTDTLTVHYKGSLYSDGSIFDQTKQKPAIFPLDRLIKGWQLGLVHCKVGGKMRLFITSGSAYGIRTRSANIPPNSILVFDVEVLDAKERIAK
jgi:FKBP-type peptidyl-prolyl cis-trans isomerase FkpA